MTSEGTILSDKIQLLDLNDDDGGNGACKISTHTFQLDLINSTPVFFLVHQFPSSLLIWVGGADGRLNELAYSAKTCYDKGLPSTTQLITSSGELTSGYIAAKLTKKLGKPVFLSFNIPETQDPSQFHSIQKRLLEEIEKNPLKF